MFTDIAPFYDLVKSHRNHDGEAAAIRGLIHRHAPQAKTVLEVACGTGTLLARLKGYERIGVDASAPMLSQARKKLGDEVTLVHGKMQDFQLPQPGADVLLLLDGAIGYAGPAELEPTVSNLARHLVDGGLLVVEPWYTPDEWEPKKIHVTHHSDDVVTVVRVGYGYPDGRIDFANIIGSSSGLHTFDERYDFTLHPEAAMVEAFQAAGFTEVRKEAAPEFGRGLWVARKP